MFTLRSIGETFAELREDFKQFQHDLRGPDEEGTPLPYEDKLDEYLANMRRGN